MVFSYCWQSMLAVGWEISWDCWLGHLHAASPCGLGLLTHGGWAQESVLRTSSPTEPEDTARRLRKPLPLCSMGKPGYEVQPTVQGRRTASSCWCTELRQGGCSADSLWRQSVLKNMSSRESEGHTLQILRNFYSKSEGF